MGTKSKPAAFDCYANAELDEPMFVLLARDRVGAEVVRWWVALRAVLDDAEWSDIRDELDSIVESIRTASEAEMIDLPGVADHHDLDQLREALECADAMDAWRTEHRA